MSSRLLPFITCDMVMAKKSTYTSNDTLCLHQSVERGVHNFVVRHVREGVPLLLCGVPNAVQWAYNNLQGALDNIFLSKYAIDLWEPYPCAPYSRRRLTATICTTEYLPYSVCYNYSLPQQL